MDLIPSRKILEQSINEYYVSKRKQTISKVTNSLSTLYDMTNLKIALLKNGSLSTMRPISMKIIRLLFIATFREIALNEVSYMKLFDVAFM